ncbi:MAG: lysylphosphatidylglycerol synthase transmembrane domain-containing protein, partial [Cyclobacteriaceae bacterium]
MEKARLKKYLQTALKVTFTVVALYIVFRKIDPDETLSILSRIKILYLFPAILLFVLSKVVSSYRLNQYFKAIGLQLSESYNLKLYWIGMFYNLFLPGGIGGDGYKVYLLNKNYQTGIKPLVAATLIDRISGLMALLFLLLLLCLPLLPFSFLQGYDLIIYIGLVTGYPLYYVFNKLLFPGFIKKTLITSLYSLAVQILQVFSALFILYALDVDSQFIAYQVLFLASSIVAVLPFTIGGVGARELTFILGHEYLGIDQNVAVAFSLIFFLITALVSLVGAFLKSNPVEPEA